MYSKIKKKLFRNKKGVNPFDVVLVLTLTSTIIFSSMFLIYRKSSPSMIQDLVNSIYSYRESVNRDMLNNYQDSLVDEMLPWEVVLSIYERDGEGKKYSNDLQQKISASFYDDMVGYFFVMNNIDESFLIDKVRILLQDKIGYIQDIKYDFYNDKIKIFSYINKEEALKASAQAYRLELSKSKEFLLQIAKNDWSDNCLYLFLNYSENKLTLPNAIISDDVVPFYLTYLASDIRCTPFCRSGFYNFEISGISCGSNKLFNRDGIEEEVSSDIQNTIITTIDNLKQVLTFVDKLPFDAENKLKLVAYLIKYHPNKKIVSSLSTLDLKDPKSLEDAILTICTKDLIEKDFCYSRLNKLEKDYNTFKYDFGLTKNYVFEKSEISKVKDERLLEWTYLSKPFPIKEVSKLYVNFTEIFKKYDLGIMILPDKRNLTNITEYLNNYYNEKNETFNKVFFNSLWGFNFSISKEKSNDTVVFEELVGVSFLYSLYLNSLALKDCDINYDFFDLKKNVGTDKYKYDNLIFNLETFTDSEKTIVDNITLEIKLTDGTKKSYKISFSQIRALNNVSITKDTSVDKLKLCTELTFYYVVPFSTFGELIPKKLEYSVIESDLEKKWRLSNYEYNFLLVIEGEKISQHILKDIKEVTIDKCVKFQPYNNDAILIDFSENDENCQNLKNEIISNKDQWEISCINGLTNDFLAESTYIPLKEGDSRESKFRNLRAKARTSYKLADILVQDSYSGEYFFFAEMVICSDDDYPIFDNSLTSRTITKEKLANIKLRNLNKNYDGYTFIVNDIFQEKFAFIEYYNHKDDEPPMLAKIEKSSGMYTITFLTDLDVSLRDGVCWFSKSNTNYYEIKNLKVFVNKDVEKYNKISFETNYSNISKYNSPSISYHTENQIKLTFDINFSFNFTSVSLKRANIYNDILSAFIMKDIWNITVSAFPSLSSAFASALASASDFFNCSLKNIKLDLDPYYMIYIAEGLLNCELVLEDESHDFISYDKEISDLLNNNEFILYVDQMLDEKNTAKVECLSSVVGSYTTGGSTLVEDCGIDYFQASKNSIEKGDSVDLSYGLKANRECFYHLRCTNGLIDKPIKLAQPFDSDFSNTDPVVFDDIGTYECKLTVERDGAEVASQSHIIEVFEKCQAEIISFEITPLVAKKRENIDFSFEVNLCPNNFVNLYCVNKDSGSKIPFVSNNIDLIYKQKNYFNEIGKYDCNLEITRNSVVEISDSKQIEIFDVSALVSTPSATPTTSCTAKINSFESSKTTLKLSESVDLSWDATICSGDELLLECNDENGIQELNSKVNSIGKRTFNPSKEGTYICKLSILKSSGGVVSRSLSLNVMCERKINDFFASPIEVCKDGDVSLSWDVKICKNEKVNLYCSVDKTNYDVTSLVSKTYTVSDINNHLCTLSILDDSGNVLVFMNTNFKSLSCVVPTSTTSCTPKINEFKSSKSKIEIINLANNEKFTLSWNANLCGNEELNLVCNPGSINQKGLSASGTYNVVANLDETYSCELKLIDKSDGSIIDAKDVKVEVIDKRITFTLNTNKIEYSSTVKATWTAPAKAKSVKLILDYDSLTDIEEKLSTSGSKDYQLKDLVKFIYIVEFRDGSSKNIELPVCVLPKASLSVQPIGCKKYKVDLILEHNERFLKNQIKDVSISDKSGLSGSYSSNKMSYSTQLENKASDLNDKVIIMFNNFCNTQEVTYRYPPMTIPSFTFSGSVQHNEFLVEDCNKNTFIQKYTTKITGNNFLNYFDKFSLRSITSGNEFIKDLSFNEFNSKTTYVSGDIEINFDKSGNKLEIIRKNVQAPCGSLESPVTHLLTLTDCNGKNYEVYFEFTFKKKGTTVSSTSPSSSKSCKIDSFTVTPSKLDLAKIKKFTISYSLSNSIENKLYVKGPKDTVFQDKSGILTQKELVPTQLGKYIFNLTCKGNDGIINSKVVEAEVVESCYIDKFTLSSEKVSIGQSVKITANFRNSQLRKLLINRIQPKQEKIVDETITKENHEYTWNNIKELGTYNITIQCNSSSSNEIVQQSKIVEVSSPCESTTFSVDKTNLLVGENVKITYSVSNGAKLNISITSSKTTIPEQSFTSSGSTSHKFDNEGIYKIIGKCFEGDVLKIKKEIEINVIKPKTTKECKPVTEFKIDSKKINNNLILKDFNQNLQLDKFSYEFEISFNGKVSSEDQRIVYEEPKKLNLVFSIDTKKGRKEFTFSISDTSKSSQDYFLISNYGDVKKENVNDLLNKIIEDPLNNKFGFPNENNDDFYLISLFFTYDPTNKIIKVKLNYYFKIFFYQPRLKRLKNNPGTPFYLIPTGLALNFDNSLIFNIDKICENSNRKVQIKLNVYDKVFSQIFNKINDAREKLYNLLNNKKVGFITSDRSLIGNKDYIFKYDGFYDPLFKNQQFFPYLSIIKYYFFDTNKGTSYILICLSRESELYCAKPITYGELEHILEKNSKTLVFLDTIDSSFAKLYSSTFGYVYFKDYTARGYWFLSFIPQVVLVNAKMNIIDDILLDEGSSGAVRIQYSSGVHYSAFKERFLNEIKSPNSYTENIVNVENVAKIIKFKSRDYVIGKVKYNEIMEYYEEYLLNFKNIASFDFIFSNYFLSSFETTSLFYGERRGVMIIYPYNHANRKYMVKKYLNTKSDNSKELVSITTIQ
ncbi:MAG: hypothetical protein QXS41_03615 [Candidatus Woesearchaeota archaeon]